MEFSHLLRQFLADRFIMVLNKDTRLTGGLSEKRVQSRYNLFERMLKSNIAETASLVVRIRK